MKVSANLSFLLGIGSVMMPVIEASTKGFGSMLSAAAKKRSTSIKRQEIFDFVAAQQQSIRDLKSASVTGSSPGRSAATKRAWKHQQRVLEDGGLQLHDDALAADLLAECEVGIEFVLGPNSGCTCTEEEPSTECTDFVSENCNFCDTLLGEQACFSFPEITFDDVGFTECITYESGPFNNTICKTDNFIESTCAITIDGEECSSCRVIDCDGNIDNDIDCSNIIAGENWNLCTDEVPETSPFFAVANNLRFEDLSCDTGFGDPLALCESLLEVELGAASPCTCVADGEGSFDVECDLLAVCDAFLEEEFGPNSPCTCVGKGEDFDVECDYDYDCVLQDCETLQGQETCVEVDEAAANALEAEPDTFVGCFKYGSGLFDNAICLIVNDVDSTCTITLDGNECTSCTLIYACSASYDDDGIFDNDGGGGGGIFGSNLQFDCSNIIAGETWNLCTADIPETSPFVAVGNVLFTDPSCKPETTEAPTEAPPDSEVVAPRPSKKEKNRKNMKEQKNMKKQKKQKKTVRGPG
jgi:hypothetical protein